MFNLRLISIDDLQNISNIEVTLIASNKRNNKEKKIRTFKN